MCLRVLACFLLGHHLCFSIPFDRRILAIEGTDKVVKATVHGWPEVTALLCRVSTKEIKFDARSLDPSWRPHQIVLDASNRPCKGVHTVWPSHSNA